MATLRELKGRIGSVSSTEKITGAMKMISSAKMHKAEMSLKRLVPFKSQIQSIMANVLGSDAQFASPLLDNRPLHHATLVAWGSDDGLCGAYNVNLGKYVAAHVRQLQDTDPGIKIHITAVGKKMARALQHLASSTVTVEQAADVDSKSEGPAVDAMMRRLQDQFTSGNTDTVQALYVHYYTAGRQRPLTHTLLPLNPDTLQEHSDNTAAGQPVIFEPDANAIFNAVLPMTLMSTLQEIFIENRASEQAARVMAMQSANDNARKLLEQLRLEYNKLRQQSITNELLDIVGGQRRD